MNVPSFTARCLVFARTGKRCRSCLPRWQKNTYREIVASGRCGQCKRFPPGELHGKLCQPCHERQQARNRAKAPVSGRVCICVKCGKPGHFAKTCDRRTSPPLMHTAARVTGAFVRQTHTACGLLRINGAAFTCVGRMVTCPTCKAMLKAKRAKAREEFAAIEARMGASSRRGDVSL